MGNFILHYGNKVYTLKPRFITNLQERFRKLKLRLYKRKKIKASKTPYQRYYYMKFKIKVADEHNPQESNFDYETIVTARAAFFAKAHLEKSIKEKVFVDVVDWEEMTEEEHEEYIQSKAEYLANEKSNDKLN